MQYNTYHSVEPNTSNTIFSVSVWSIAKLLCLEYGREPFHVEDYVINAILIATILNIYTPFVPDIRDDLAATYGGTTTMTTLLPGTGSGREDDCRAPSGPCGA